MEYVRSCMDSVCGDTLTKLSIVSGSRRAFELSNLGIPLRTHAPVSTINQPSITIRLLSRTSTQHTPFHIQHIEVGRASRTARGRPDPVATFNDGYRIRLERNILAHTDPPGDMVVSVFFFCHHRTYCRRFCGVLSPRTGTR